jgi:hypothetical protein
VSWGLVSHRITECIDPAQRLALVGPQNELVVIMERSAGAAKRGPRRPRPFRLDTPPEAMGGCCAPRDAKGWFFAWVDRRRELYTYAYAGRGSPEVLARVLDSLSVAPRG